MSQKIYLLKYLKTDSNGQTILQTLSFPDLITRLGNIVNDVVENEINSDPKYLLNNNKELGQSFIDAVTNAVIKGAALTSNQTQTARDLTITNHWASILGNKVNAEQGSVNNQGILFLLNTTTFNPPINQDLTHTPTVSEFMQAAVASTQINSMPDGMKPFLYNGLQLGMSDTAVGMAAKVFVTPENQVIISYQATLGESKNDPVHAFHQVMADLQIMAGMVTPGEKDAVKFAQFVAKEAQKQGYSTNDIFVTGHSLGAIEAEYVSQQTGLAGIGFDSTGIPADKYGGNGKNFIDVLQYGDPVSSLSSDVEGESPFGPVYSPDSNGTLPHYGNIIMVGDVKNQQWLHDMTQEKWANGGLKGKLEGASSYLKDGMGGYHMAWLQAKNLGVEMGMKGLIIKNGQVSYTPNDTQESLDVQKALENASLQGAALNVGNMSIQNFLAFNETRADYHSPALPTVFA